MSDSPKAIHNTDACRFELALEAGIGTLEYQLHGSSMDVHHTFVPIELRGKNVAAQLAHAAFDYARTKNLRVIPSCSYIATYARRHPEAAELL